MKLLLRRLLKKEQGATAIEFAFVAPVLLLFVFGIIEYGVIMTTQSSLEGSISQAARQHRALARSNSEGADVAAVRNYVIGQAGGLINAENLQLEVHHVPWGAAPPTGEGQQHVGSTDDVVHYVATYNYNVMTPFLAPILGGENGVLQLPASTVVHNEPAIGGAGGT